MVISVFPRLARRWAGIVAVAALAAGCASMSATPEAIVRDRAAQSWKALVAGDLDRAYGFTPPSYRAVTSLADYKKGFGVAVKWTAAGPVSVKCPTPDKCVALVKIEAKPLLGRGAPPLVTYSDETWVRENGQWWVFPTQ